MHTAIAIGLAIIGAFFVISGITVSIVWWITYREDEEE